LAQVTCVALCVCSVATPPTPLDHSPLVEPAAVCVSGSCATVTPGSTGTILVLASGGGDGVVRVWDAGTGIPCGPPLLGHRGVVRSVALQVVPAQAGGTLHAHSSGGSGCPGSGQLTSDFTTLLVSSGDDGQLIVWSLSTWSALHILSPCPHAVLAVATAPCPASGRVLLACGAADGCLRVWDLPSMDPAGEPIAAHGLAVKAIAMGVNPATQRLVLASAGADSIIRVWDVESGRPVGGPLVGHAGPVASVALAASPLDGRLLVGSGGVDGDVRVWDVVSGRPASECLTAHSDRARSASLAVSPSDGRLLLFSGSDDGTVRVWGADSGRTAGSVMKGHRRGVWGIGTVLEPGPAGRLLLASGCRDGAVCVWDAGSGASLCPPLLGHAGSVQSLAVGMRPPDGRVLVMTGGEDCTVRLWDVTPVCTSSSVRDTQARATAEALAPAPAPSPTVPHQVLQGHSAPVLCVVMVAVAGPEPRLLAATSGNNPYILVWDLDAGGAPTGRPLHGHSGSVWAIAMAVSPREGRVLLASAGADGTLRLWDVGALAPVGPSVSRGSGDICCVSMAVLPSDGRVMVACGGDHGTLRLWDMTAGVAMCAYMCAALLHAINRQ
jgi:WD40 repeat protein